MAATSDFLFSPVPAIREASRTARCATEWHQAYTPKLVEQFDGSWREQGCTACAWEAIHNTPPDQQAHQVAMAEFQAGALNRRLVGTGITPRFRGCTFDTFVAEGDTQKADALAQCREYAEQFEQHARTGRGLLLLGNVGNGKTHLACAIVQHVIRAFEAYAVVTSAAEICRVMRGSFSKAAAYSDRDVLDQLAAPDLLVIDEVGVQSTSEFAPGVLSDVIDRRYQQLRPTILVSNRRAMELVQFIGDRAVDRMRQGGGSVVGFHWQSARGAV
ncbi:ATP-binding protein [Pseudomonas sp. UBA6323]|uniref:ATP-binding protein n=1 Tax=Pseudomonas sp. UBA6323 TaxID=1947329 RepID=UPI0025F9501F|nr:ATP-binding protein [Pseudomonas sp. UBA6323]